MNLSKKVFLASVIIFLVISLFWGIYKLSFDKKDSSITQEKKEKKELSLNQKENLPITSITQEAALSPTILPDGVTIQYYARENGKVFQTDINGNNKKALSSNELNGLQDVIWSDSKENVIAKFKQNGKNYFSYFSFSKKKGGKFDENIKSINFQKENKIIYTYRDTYGKSSLSVADFDGKNWKKISDIDFWGQKIKSVPKSGLISFWNNPDANYESKLYTIPLIGGPKKLIFSGKFGGDFLWNEKGSVFLVSTSNQKNGSQMNLGIFDFKNNKYKNLEIPTLIQKCVWSKDNETVFFALPGSIPEGAVLPNDYLQNKFKTTDTFWKVNIKSGEKERIIDLDKIEQGFDATNLFLNNDESILFFVNRDDGKIYRIKL